MPERRPKEKHFLLLTSRNITPHQNSYIYFHIQPITYNYCTEYVPGVFYEQIIFNYPIVCMTKTVYIININLIFYKPFKINQNYTQCSFYSDTTTRWKYRLLNRARQTRFLGIYVVRSRLLNRARQTRHLRCVLVSVHLANDQLSRSGRKKQQQIK